MSARFTFTVDHMIGREELELVVTYSVTPGRGETPPAYSHGGLPAEPDEVELVSITHNGQPITLADDEADALFAIAMEHAGDDWAEEVAAAEEYRAELRADDRMMERWERGL